MGLIHLDDSISVDQTFRPSSYVSLHAMQLAPFGKSRKADHYPNAVEYYVNGALA